MSRFAKQGHAASDRWSLSRLKSGAVDFVRHLGGVSAIEFALTAPVVVFGLLTTVDLALAAYQRMTMEHVLRAGAQRAMSDPGVPSVAKFLETTAAENFTVGAASPAPGKPSISLLVDRYCVCPGTTGAKVDCALVCGSSAPTLAYYSLSASRQYSGLIIPKMTLSPQVQVQVR